ncbi:F-box family protein, partial [Trifolium medium]|nr:F-box family protein [Trifolium medium]
TRHNLAHRKVIPLEDSRDCVMREGVDESSLHLFLHCDFAAAVWSDVLK